MQPGENHTAPLAPHDALDHASALDALLRKLPLGTDPFLRVGRGWYKLLSVLEQDLRDADPQYRLELIEQRDGVLHVRAAAAAPNRQAAVGDAVAKAVRTSRLTCEFTGGPGLLMQRRGVLRTLDPTCAPPGYAVVTRPASNDVEQHLLCVVDRLHQKLRQES